MNTLRIENSKYAQGLGFGGVFGEHRLWIDNDIETKSYARPKDNCFEIGYIAGSNENLHITHIEIYGFGGDTALLAREKHRKLM